MTDPTNHPQGAEVILQQRYASVDETFEASAIAAMHTHTEDWLKYFAERVKEKTGVVAYLYEAEIDSLLSEVIAKMNGESVQQKNDGKEIITVEWLMQKHPELYVEDAVSLMLFSDKKTIRQRRCYGDGSIMYPVWKKEMKEGKP